MGKYIKSRLLDTSDVGIHLLSHGVLRNKSPAIPTGAASHSLAVNRLACVHIFCVSVCCSHQLFPTDISPPVAFHTFLRSHDDLVHCVVQAIEAVVRELQKKHLNPAMKVPAFHVALNTSSFSCNVCMVRNVSQPEGAAAVNYLQGCMPLTRVLTAYAGIVPLLCRVHRWKQTSSRD